MADPKVQVIEPVTGTVLAECDSKAEALAWARDAANEHRNAGSIPPSYRLKEVPHGVKGGGDAA